jgi:hypothetical protein
MRVAGMVWWRCRCRPLAPVPWKPAVLRRREAVPGRRGRRRAVPASRAGYWDAGLR